MDYPPPDFIERISVMMEREKMCSLTSHDLFSQSGLKPDMREIISRWYLEVIPNEEKLFLSPIFFF